LPGYPFFGFGRRRRPAFTLGAARKGNRKMRTLSLTIAFFVSLLPMSAQSQVCPTITGLGSTVVQIDGVQLSFADLEREGPSPLFQARNAFYEAQRKALDELIDKYLLERQAQKERVGVAELLDRHVNARLPADPSDEALRVYFDGLDVNEPFEAVRDKIVEHLRQRRAAKARAAYIASLRAQAKVSIELTAPRTDVSLAGLPLLGPARAPVTIVEYADYECPYCQQIQPALDRILAEYKDKVVFAYKDLPVPSHPAAQKASEAAHCAAAQGKYWEFHKSLVPGKDLDVPNLKKRARDLKLNAEAFDKCLDSGEKAPILSANIREAQALGLQGTPSFFINGRFFSGALPYEQLRDIVEEELKRAALVAQNAGGQ
jgi:protein-disulfide isomerase